MKINVIVPAYKASSTIEPCLDALFAAGFTVRDVIVVDDGSPDDTIEKVRGRGIEPVCPGANQGAARTRNAGVAASDGDILFFVDSDVVVHRDVRQRLEQFFASHPDHAGVFGSYDDSPIAPPRISRLRNLLHHHVHQRSAGAATTFWTGCGALRRQDFLDAGGFRREDEMIEDVGLGLRLARLGRPVILDPALLCTHLKSWSWRGFAMTDYRHRAQPWTRMMYDPANADMGHTLNAGRRGKAAVICVGTSLLSLPLLFGSLSAALLAALAGLGGLACLERRFVALAARKGGLTDAACAMAMLWIHYLAAGAGYARVRLFG